MIIDKAIIIKVQKALGVSPDGIWGPKSAVACIRFQSNSLIVANGIIDSATVQALEILDTDLRNEHIIRMNGGCNIIKHWMPSDEYVSKDYNGDNDYIFLHHTAGWGDPFKTIDIWAKDNRGRVGVEFIIGGPNFITGSSSKDGIIAQAFPDGCQAFHLGKTGSQYMNKHSVGIEVCNFGQLDDSWKNYINGLAHESQRTELEEPFRGFSKWHKYSDKQLHALSQLLMHVADRDSIDLQEGLVKWIHAKGASKAFDFNQDAYEGKVKGLLTHTNVRKDKYDMAPQKELVDMLMTL